jgi:hypothetical protein
MILALNTFAYLMIVWGIYYAIGDSRISQPLRQAMKDQDHFIYQFVLELIECPACVGFWLGLIAGGLIWSQFETFPKLAQAIYLGLFTLGVNSWLMVIWAKITFEYRPRDEK